MKKLSILGSTGTIGLNTLDVVRKNSDKLKVVCISADNNWQMLANQIKEFQPDLAVINNKKYYKDLKQSLSSTYKTKILAGEEGLKEVATYNEADIIISAISGISGIKPSYYAIDAGKYVALANKETLVSAGQIITKKVKESGSKIIPVDSEHSAIFQLINEKNKDEVHKIVLPASGGPFLDYSHKELDSIDLKNALEHPVWKMGKKITIDSATLANKGLEVIEAHYLFGLSYSKISVLIHRQCIVHGMVELKDGSILAHLGFPDMKLPISFAIFYPQRIKAIKRCGVKELSMITFEEVDKKKFPFLDLAYEVGKKGMSYPAVFNTADDLAVNAFLDGKIKFNEIYKTVETIIEKHTPFTINEIDDVFEAEKWTKNEFKKILKSKEVIC